MAGTLTRVLLLAVLAVAVAGCDVGLDVAVDVDRDGGGRLSVALRADPEALAGVAQADPLGAFAAAAQAQGWDVRSTTEEDGSRSVAAAVDFADPAELERLSGELAEAMAAAEGRLLEPLRVTLTDETVRVDGAAGLVPGAAVADLGLTPESATSLLAATFTYTVRVRLPDPERVLTSDATRTDGERLVWEVPAGSQITLTAEGVRPRFPWLLAGGSAAAGLLVLVLAWVLLRRRRRRGPRGRLVPPDPEGAW